MGCCSTNLEEQNACHSQVCKNLLFHKIVNVVVLNIPVYLASTQTLFVKSIMNCLYLLVLSVQVVIKLTHFSHGASLSLTAAPADTFLH